MGGYEIITFGDVTVGRFLPPPAKPRSLIQDSSFLSWIYVRWVFSRGWRGLTYPGVSSHDVDDADDKLFASLIYVSFDQVKVMWNVPHQQLPSGNSPSHRSSAGTAYH